MPRQLPIIIAVGAALALILVGAALRFAVFAPSSAQASGTVLSVISQEVLVHHAGASAPVKAKDGEALSEGDRILTRESGRAVITFFEGSTQTVEPNTVITLKRLSSNSGGGLLASIGQTVGTTWTTVFNTSDAGSDVQVESPAATAAVRDTMFQVQVAPGTRTSVWTRQGTVAVRARGNVRDVTADNRVVIDPGSASRPLSVLPAPVNELKLTLDGAGWLLVRDPNGYSSGFVPPGAPVNQIPLARIDDPSVRPQSVALASFVDGAYDLYVRTDTEGTFRLTADDGLGWATQCAEEASGLIRPGETWLVSATLHVVDEKLVGCSLSDPQLTHDDPYSKIRVPNPLAVALAAGRRVIPEFAVLGVSTLPQPTVTSPSATSEAGVTSVPAVRKTESTLQTPAVAATASFTESPPSTQTPVEPLATSTAVPPASSMPPASATDVPPATVPPSATSTTIPTIPPSPAPTATPPATPTAVPTAIPTASPTPYPTATPSGPCAPSWADVNGDGAVTDADAALVASYFGQSSPPAPAAYDVDGDHRITISDLQAVQAYLGLNVCP